MHQFCPSVVINNVFLAYVSSSESNVLCLFFFFFFLLQMGCCFCDVTSESDSIQGWLSSNLSSHPCVGYVQSYQWKGNLDQ